jgi:hypothetical protein
LTLDSYQLGYWPKKILTHLATGASSVQYGGATFSPPDMHTPVPMGNGFLPSFVPNRAGLFEHIQIINAQNQMVDTNSEMLGPFYDVGAQCYRLDFFSTSFLGQALSFGGPGGVCP